MGRLIDPYARLFKLDNPIAHQGCGPGMYSQMNSRGGTAGPILDVDVFGIPAAFLHGLLGYEYKSTNLTLHPRLPPGVSTLVQKFPVRWGTGQLFFTLQQSSNGGSSSSSSKPQAGAPDGAVVGVTINGTACSSCVAADGESVSIPWAAAMEGAPTTIAITVAEHGQPPAAQHEQHMQHTRRSSIVPVDGASARRQW